MLSDYFMIFGILFHLILITAGSVALTSLITEALTCPKRKRK